MALTPPPSAPPAAPPAPGDAPSRANPSTFRELADAFVVWQVGFRDWLAGMVAWLASYITWAGTNVAEMGALQTDVASKSSAATTAASSAATSAASVQANTTALNNRLYPGTYPADPITRPDGSAVQQGDRYFNSSISRQKTYSGSVWGTDNLDSATLALYTGAALIGGLDIFAVTALSAAEYADSQLSTPVRDLTASLQAAINAAIASKKRVILPGGRLRYASTLTIGATGFTIVGAGTYLTTLLFVGAGDAISYLDPVGSTETRNPVLQGFALDGPGTGVSAGSGINASAKPATYNGSQLQLNAVSIRFFAKGMYLNFWDQVVLGAGTRLDGNGINLHLAPNGNVNTLSMVGASTGNAVTTDILAESGCGIVIMGGDHVTQEGIRTRNANTQVTVIGGNFENCMGEGAFVAETNTTIIGMGNRFLRQGAGVEMSPVRAKSNSRVVLIAPINAYSSPTVYKEASAIVRVIAPGTTLFAGGNDISENGLTVTRGGPFHQLLGPNPSAAAATMRGEVAFVAQQDAAGQEDRIVAYIRNRSAAYELVDLLQSRERFSLTGTAHARVQGMSRFEGEMPFTTAAGTFTDVVVTIGAFTSFYAGRATVYDPSNHFMVPVRKSNSNAGGTVTFRVNHPNDAGGGIAAFLDYSISVVV